MLKPLSKKQVESLSPRSPVLCLVRDLTPGITFLVRGRVGQSKKFDGRDYFQINHPRLVYPRLDNQVIRACRFAFLADRWDLRVFEDLGGPPKTGNTAFGIAPRAFAKTARFIKSIVDSTARDLGARIGFSADEATRIISLAPESVIRFGDQLELSFHTPTKDPDDDGCSMAFRLPCAAVRATYGLGGVLNWIDPDFFRGLPRSGKEKRP